MAKVFKVDIGFFLLSCVSGVVHRYYESQHRLFNDEQPGRWDVAMEVKAQSKKKALQRQVLCK